ncbi:HDOD domain-containing protein [candidate division GN15 bacterium]|nr:HDOD domain-containing protein [candidate division GN15 bacterium]
MAEAISSNEPVVDSKVKQVVSNIRNLPTPPIVFHQIQKVINDPKVSAGQIAGILSEDPAMSVKVLKLTNSAFYGLSREIDSVKQAVVVVGLEAIKNLVLSASVIDMFKGKDYDQEFQEQFWRHSLATAFCGRIISRKLRARGLVDPDTAFSGGLLHDIGKIIIACYLPDHYKRYSEARAAEKVATDYDIESSVLGYTHDQVGALLAAQWKLPAKLCEAITYHHHPEKAPSGEAIGYLVHVANHIAKKTFYFDDDAFRVGELSAEVMDYMQLTDGQIEMFCESLREEYVKAETFMQMAGLTG